MKRRVPILFLAPSALLLLAIAAYPVGYGVWAGFHQWNWSLGQADDWTFIGLDNYIDVLGNREFWNSIKVTVYFTAISVTLELVVGLGIALLLHKNVVASWFFRSQ